MVRACLILSTVMLMACAQEVVPKPSPIQKTTRSAVKKVILKQWLWDDNYQHWIKNGKIFDANVRKKSSVAWEPKEGAITIAVDSVRFPNVLGNQRQTLLMKVFQFTDPTAFVIATQSATGLKHLLTAAQIDPACINDKHFFIPAGRGEKITLKRVGGARYLGIVVGYANLRGARIARLIPIVTLNKRKVIDVKKHSPSMLTNVLRPASLALKLSLGANGITHLNIDAK